MTETSSETKVNPIATRLDVENHDIFDTYTSISHDVGNERVRKVALHELLHHQLTNYFDYLEATSKIPFDEIIKSPGTKQSELSRQKRQNEIDRESHRSARLDLAKTAENSGVMSLYVARVVASNIGTERQRIDSKLNTSNRNLRLAKAALNRSEKKFEKTRDEWPYSPVPTLFTPSQQASIRQMFKNDPSKKPNDFDLEPPKELQVTRRQTAELDASGQFVPEKYIAKYLSSQMYETVSFEELAHTLHTQFNKRKSNSEINRWALLADLQVYSGIVKTLYDDGLCLQTGWRKLILYSDGRSHTLHVTRTFRVVRLGDKLPNVDVSIAKDRHLPALDRRHYDNWDN